MPIEQVLAELRKAIKFKETTSERDVVLVGMEQGLSYGVVLDIKPDVKPEWWDVHFKLLVIPPVDLTWILRTPQMCGEIFNVNGVEHFMVAVTMDIQRKEVKKPAGRTALSLVKKARKDREK